ncbi:M91 family zinc metallopeptidase [Myxococcus fulvus]|uniref:M91 family zinc metallopeptidase n=1 Tax=Myxococcus fulvus TaxID=33 RepID=UPI003B9A018E
MKLRSRPSFSTPSSAPKTDTTSRPRSNSTPAKPDTTSLPKARPSASDLQDGKSNLKPTDYGVTHPDLPGIRTRRDAGQSGAQFADFTRDTRESTQTLMNRPTGNRMMTELDGRTQALNPGQTGTVRNPLTSTDIYSGRNADMPMSHLPRHQGTFESIRPAYRHDGQPSAGLPSRINYDESAPGHQRFNSLGHESVHAWRASNGLQVGSIESSKHANADVFNRYPDFADNMKANLNRRTMLTEEFETVGLKPTPHTPAGWAPTENKIRAEHGLPSRNDYSGRSPTLPNPTNEAIQRYDEGSDNRSVFQKMIGTPTPIGKILGDIEG